MGLSNSGKFRRSRRLPNIFALVLPSGEKGEKLYLASLDVLQGFDHVTMKLALQSMGKLGFDPALIYALLCPMTQTVCKTAFEGAQHLDWI
eukprot:183602-Pyramimonas_sp.AAC.1